MEYKILVKFPSRERPHKFFLCIKKYIDNQTTNNVRYLITLDNNDPLNLAYRNYCETLKSQGVNIEYVVGDSLGKIDAVNRDMPESSGWDIVVLASDDMQCQVQGWDAIIQNEMFDYCQDTDGVLFHKDGYTQLNTMCIIGRKYFDRFGYIYQPDYISLWADNEFMEVSRLLNKEYVFEQVLFRHEHFSNSGSYAHTKDVLMRKNESYYYQDEATFKRRKQINFGL